MARARCDHVKKTINLHTRHISAANAESWHQCSRRRQQLQYGASAAATIWSISSSYKMEHFPFFFPNIFESMPPLFISSLPATRVGSTSAKCSSSCNTSDASNRRSLSALQDESMICSRPLQHRDHCTADQSDLGFRV